MGKLRICLSLAESILSVSKSKFTSFHLGLALQMLWFFVCSTFQICGTQKSCGYTWGLCLVVKMIGDIFQFTICVARFLISHVRFYPPFTLLLDVTLPLLFSEFGKNMLTNLENITWRVVWFSFTDQCWSWNYNEYSKTCIIFFIRSKGNIQVVSSWPLHVAGQISNKQRCFAFSYST